MTERDVRVYLGYSQPRRGRQVTLHNGHSGDALVAAVHAAFNLPLSGEPYGVFVVVKGTQDALGNLADADEPPCSALAQLDEQQVPYELVALPLAEMAAAEPRAESHAGSRTTAEASESEPALNSYNGRLVGSASFEDAASAGPVGASLSTAAVSMSSGVAHDALAQLSAADVDALDRRTADKFADKLARRIAKLTTYAETRSAAMQPGDVVVQRKLQRAAKEIAHYSEQLVLIEEHIAELDMLNELADDDEMSANNNQSDKTNNNDDDYDDYDTVVGASGKPGHANDSTSESTSTTRAAGQNGASSNSKPLRKERANSSASSVRRLKESAEGSTSTTKARSSPKLRQRRERRSTKKSKKVSTRGDSDSASGKETIDYECDMCGDVFGLDRQQPRWVYVPAISGVQRLVVCGSCRRSVKGEPGVRTEDSTGGADGDSKAARRRSVVLEQFRAQLVAHCGPSEPVLFGNLRVPRYYEQRQKVYSGSMLLSPDVVVSRFKESGTLHIKYLMSAEPLVVAHQSPLVSLRYAAPYVLAMHDDDTLQAVDISQRALVASLDCSPSFADDTSGRSRTLIANERWVVVASKQRVCVWPWRIVLASSHSPDVPAATPAAHTMTLDRGAGDNPRDDFCALKDHNLILGSNQSFSVWDVLTTQCIFRFSFRDTNSAIAAFYSVRLAGDTVVTQEAGGVRVWLIGAQVARARERGGDAALPVVPSLPPLIEPEDKKAIFTSIHADSDYLILGDNYGRVRVRPLTSSVSSKAASLMGVVDADGLPIEYLNHESWLKSASKVLLDSGSKRRTLALSTGAQSRLKGTGASLENKINHLARHENMIYCAQENGLFSVWSLQDRQAKEPLHKYVCEGPIRLFDQHQGTVMLGCNEPHSGTPIGDDTAVSTEGDLDEEDDDYHWLKVSVCNYAKRSVRLDQIESTPPLPRGEKAWRMALFFGADGSGSSNAGKSGEQSENGESAVSLSVSWENTLIERFGALSMRAEAQRAFFVGVSRRNGDAIESARQQLKTPLRIVKQQSLLVGLGFHLAKNFATQWYEPTVSEAGATIAIMPGAEPFNPISMQVLVNIDGFVKSYSISARYGVAATPARVWAFVNKQLLAPAMHAQRPQASNNSLTRRRRIGALFRGKSERKKP